MEISEIGYTKVLTKWTGLTGYNFRKSQFVTIHARSRSGFTDYHKAGSHQQALSKCVGFNG
ncbi:MAG: hypothetical protein ITG06_07240 [Planococcus sp. (in: Bacteria)]|nr:hypothetical protein [Planococcus sp. (in: firmicutes)]